MFLHCDTDCARLSIRQNLPGRAHLQRHKALQIRKATWFSPIISEATLSAQVLLSPKIGFNGHHWITGGRQNRISPEAQVIKFPVILCKIKATHLFGWRDRKSGTIKNDGPKKLQNTPHNESTAMPLLLFGQSDFRFATLAFHCVVNRPLLTSPLWWTLARIVFNSIQTSSSICAQIPTTVINVDLTICPGETCKKKQNFFVNNIQLFFTSGRIPHSFTCC